MDDQILNFAQLRYIAEQEARHIRIRRAGFTTITASPCPNFKEIWISITPKLRTYIERAQLLAPSTQAEAQTDFEGFLKTLYEKCFASITELDAEKTPSVTTESYHLLGMQGAEDGNNDQAVCSQDEDVGMANNAFDDHDPSDHEGPIISVLENAVTEGANALEKLDWERESRILFKELLDSLGDVMQENVLKDSDASVARDKIKAVYPQLQLKNISNTAVEKHLGDANVSALLGSTLTFEKNNARVFSRRLKSYIDNKRKRRGPKKASQKDIAEDYMEHCSAHWIVSLINRAVDDKVANDLLGHNLTMQMHMDRAFNSISFVYTKTGDISVSEVQVSLRLELPSVRERERRDAQCVRLECELKEFKKNREHITDELSMIEDDIGFNSRLLNRAHNLNPLDSSPIREKKAGDGDLGTAINSSEDASNAKIIDVSVTGIQEPVLQ
ncbi:hypothetical protein BBP40_007859 [Aspergillus hancockii]|nr:hypothetical protein BBP40_007859 [Aspergillus hancockii]